MPETRFFDNKLVLITGGSKGLGFVMAREFGGQGAQVVILARHGDEVAEAEERLRAEGLNVEGHACDVSRQDEIESLIDDVQARLGPIDVLVNNAGTIEVGPVDTMTIDNVKGAMDIMFWGVVYPTMKLLPAMRARDSGRIVNITSIGGKVAVPHLLPYNAATFAAVGFSEGLQGELGTTGVKVVTVVPGLMRTGSFVNALFHGETRDEFRWFSLSSSAPLLTISAESAAKRIVRAAENGEAEVILTIPANILARFKGVFPGITQGVLTIAQRLLPPSTGQQGSMRGSDVQRAMHSKLHERAITLGNRAVERLQPSETANRRSGQ